MPDVSMAFEEPLLLLRGGAHRSARDAGRCSTVLRRGIGGVLVLGAVLYTCARVGLRQSGLWRRERFMPLTLQADSPMIEDTTTQPVETWTPEIGDIVRVRDDPVDDWLPGIVAKLSPLKARLLPSNESSWKPFEWNYVELTEKVTDDNRVETTTSTTLLPWPERNTSSRRAIFKIKARYAYYYLPEGQEPNDKFKVFELPRNTTVGEFHEMISEEFLIPTPRLQICLGDPFAPLGEPDMRAIPREDFHKTIAEVGFTNMDTAIINETVPPGQEAALPSPMDVVDADGPVLAPVDSGAASATESMAALATGPTQCKALDLAFVPSSAEVGDLQRYMVTSDNSCLFNAVAYLLQERFATAPVSAQVLRDIVSEKIRSDPGRWDSFTLAESGKPSLEYADEIRKPTTWGGSLELLILAECFTVQITSISISDLRIDNYPHEAPGNKRIYVLYNGAHYDAIKAKPVMTDRVEEYRVFAPDDEATLNKAVGLALDLQSSVTR